MKRNIGRTDGNQPEIMKVLRGVGAEVWFIGYPLDLLVAFRGLFHILEVKVPGEKPSSKQEKTLRKMRDSGCKAYVVHSVADALKAIGAIGGNDG